MSKDEDITQDMKLGSSLKLSFDEASGAGYLWEFEASDDLKVLFWSEALSGDDDVGSDGVAHFIVKPLNAGTHTLTFRHKRPWESTDLETRTYTFNVQP